MYVYTYIYMRAIRVQISPRLEITPNTTPKLLVDWMFIDDICEQDLLVSAFDCLLQDEYIYIYIYMYVCIYLHTHRYRCI